MSNADTRFIPGHGPLATRADLVRYRDMLVTVRDRVVKLIAQQKTLKEILDAKPAADLDAQWGNGNIKADQFLTIVYQSLTQRDQGR